MKKYILILAILAVGCDAPVIEGHGFWAGQEGDETFIAGPSETTDVYNKFMELVPAEKQQQVEDDLEVFLVDFEPPPISEWDSELIKNFLGKWFMENANPLEEDLVSMRESLLSLFNFLAKEDLLPDGFLNTLSKSIQNS